MRPTAALVLVEVLELGLLELFDRFGEQLLVGFKAQVVDESGLFRAQKVPSAADFEVAKGNFESGTQVAKLFKRLQTLARFFGQPAQRGRHEVAKRLAVAAAHPSAHLVQVAEAKHVRIQDDDGVGVRHI